jgi:hypothetical protein
MTDLEESKDLVRRLVEIVNAGDLEGLEQVAGGQIAEAARRWIGPFRDSFPDFQMEVQGSAAKQRAACRPSRERSASARRQPQNPPRVSRY